MFRLREFLFVTGPYFRSADKMLSKPRSYTAGFTLLEMSVVLTIASLVLGGMIGSYTSYLNSQRITTTKQRLYDIQIALASYRTTNGHYPCPASSIAAQASATYAQATNCNAAATAGTYDTPPGVRGGAVPAYAINLPSEEADDAWGHRFSYAVTTALAESPVPVGSMGAISIVDSGGNSVVTPAGQAAYVIVSAGPDGIGAYTHGGALSSACAGAATMDGENCNNDATFRYTTEWSTTLGAGHYDDLVAFAVLSATTATGGLTGGCEMNVMAHSVASNWGQGCLPIGTVTVPNIDMCNLIAAPGYSCGVSGSYASPNFLSCECVHQ